MPLNVDHRPLPLTMLIPQVSCQSDRASSGSSASSSSEACKFYGRKKNKKSLGKNLQSQHREANKNPNAQEATLGSEKTHHQVLISPELKARRTSRVLLLEIVRVHVATSLAHKTAYDGSKSLYTAGELPFGSMEFAVKLGKERREINSSRVSKGTRHITQFKH